MYLKRIHTLFFHFTEVPGGLPKEKPWFLAGIRFLKDLQISLDSLATFDYNEHLKTLIVRFKQEDQFEENLRRLGEAAQFKDADGNSHEVPVTSSLNPGRNPRITITTTIKWVPLEMEFGLIKKALAEYGEVVEITRVTISTRGDNDQACKVETERLRVAMKLKKDIPTTVKVDGVDLKIYYAGQPPTCLICRKTGHMVKDCPRNKKRGWEHAEDTQEQPIFEQNNPEPIPEHQTDKAAANSAQNQNKDQPMPQGKGDNSKQARRDRKLAKKVQREFNKQVERQEQPLLAGQRNEPLGNAGEPTRAESRTPEANVEAETSAEPSNGEADNSPEAVEPPVGETANLTPSPGNPKRSNIKKRGRASPESRSSKEAKDAKRNKQHHLGLKRLYNNTDESCSSMEEDADDDFLPPGQQHRGQTAQSSEGSSNACMVPSSIPGTGENFDGLDQNIWLAGPEERRRPDNLEGITPLMKLSERQRDDEPIVDTQTDMFEDTQVAQRSELPTQNTGVTGSNLEEGQSFFAASQTASKVPLAGEPLTSAFSTLSTVPTPRLDTSIVETIDLSDSPIAHSIERQTANPEDPGSMPSQSENFSHILSVKEQRQRLSRAIMQANNQRSKANHAEQIVTTQNNSSTIPRENILSFSGPEENAGTSAPSFDRGRNHTSGTEKPNTL